MGSKSASSKSGSDVTSGKRAKPLGAYQGGCDPNFAQDGVTIYASRSYLMLGSRYHWGAVIVSGRSRFNRSIAISRGKEGPSIERTNNLKEGCEDIACREK